MKKHIIHLSDLHFRKNWEEDQGALIEALFDDIENVTRELDKTSIYIAFSGDIVKAGGERELFEEFILDIGTRLDKIGIPKKHRICVPGNHDMDFQLAKRMTHLSVVKNNFEEKDFNDYLNSDECILKEKFNNYKNFQEAFSDYGVEDDSISGSGHAISESIGVFCLNSAIFCGESSTKDKGNLRVNTRALNKWNNDFKFKHKILIMHHPLEYLCEWSKDEINKIINKNFCLFIHGHEHDQSATTWITSNNNKNVRCSAPPLLTDKHGELGYALISISEQAGVESIQYRQWTRFNNFVPGVNYSNNETGTVLIADFNVASTETTNNGIIEAATRIAFQRFKKAIELYPSQPFVWVDPIIRKKEIASNIHEEERSHTDDVFNINTIVQEDDYILIGAHPQFGCTSLATFVVHEQLVKFKKIWIYIDFKGLNINHLEREINKELQLLGINDTKVAGFVFDGWDRKNKLSKKSIEIVKERFNFAKILIMESASELNQIEGINHEDGLIFKRYFLSTLTRNKIRDLVSQYNKNQMENDDELVLKKLITDLNVLNLHRTPFNCLTLLKVKEVDFDDNPVNRTEVIKRVLFLLFNTEATPTYKIRPDLKDCEHTLGWFCEQLIRADNLYFTQNQFINDLKRFCEINVINIDIGVLFEILVINKIIIFKDDRYSFKYLYWVMYFSAHRMHHDRCFCEYVFTEMRYVSYPEIIEFYTGIDRRRDDALEILIKDITDAYNNLSNRCGFPENMNPYDLIKWNPSAESIQKMEDEMDKNVQESKLPTEIKDQFVDRYYDPKKPYDQGIQTIFREYLVENLFQAISAGSRALRNSDYASAETKKKLLNLIYQCWALITKLMLAISPILARKGNAEFAGTNFILVGNENESDQTRFQSLLTAIPEVVVEWFKEDIYSHKMGPLFFDQINNNNSHIITHYLMLTIIENRPPGWKDKVLSYIGKKDKNSYYLLSVKRLLKKELDYGFCSSSDEKEVQFLYKAVLAKHKYGTKNPGEKLIGKIKLKKNSK